MDVLAAYRDVGTYRGAAEMCGTTHKTVRGSSTARGRRCRADRKARGRNYDVVAELVADQVSETNGRITAKRLLPVARPPAMTGRPATSGGWSPSQKAGGARDIIGAGGRRCGRRVTRWSSTGVAGRAARVLRGVGLVAGAVRALRRRRAGRRRRWRMLAECFETLGGVPKVVLADRMGCLKGGVVAERGGPDPGLRPLRHALRVPPRLLPRQRPGVERDRRAPGRLCQARPDGPDRAARHRSGRGERRAAGLVRGGQRPAHSEICAVPAERLEHRGRAAGGVAVAAAPDRARPTRRKVDKLSCVRFGSARYSVPVRLIGPTVEADRVDGRVKVVDDHRRDRRRPRPGRPRRAARATTTTAAPGPTSRGAHPAEHPGREARSWPSARSPRRS